MHYRINNVPAASEIGFNGLRWEIVRIRELDMGVVETTVGYCESLEEAENIVGALERWGKRFRVAK